MDDPHIPYEGEYDTEYIKHDGKRNPVEKAPRKCCNVMKQEKNSMLAESSMRLVKDDPVLASQVLDPEVFATLSNIK